jgi:hypothetical protein
MNPEEIKNETIRLVESNLIDNPLPADDYMREADKLNSLLYNLGDMLLKLEMEYRREVQMNLIQGDKNNVAESKAKSGENYRRYKSCELLYKRGEERIRLLKKTAQIAREEYIRS